MVPLTRRLLTIPAFLLWVCALAYRFARWSERPAEDEEGWFLLFCLLGTTLAYVGWRILILADGSEWVWGWRK